jgi:tripartite-type tricarboxylate transporter receptor subunit TctC
MSGLERFREAKGRLMHRLIRMILALGALGLAPGAWAEEPYPSRAIRLVVPFPPGGTTDLLGRLVAERLGPAYSHRVIVENRPRASGHVGAEQVAKAPGDGYTLVAGTIGIHAAYSIYRKLNYSPAAELQPVTILAELPNVLLVPPAFPANDLKEFLALARAQPGGLNYGSAGPGSSIHMVTELFLLMSGAKLTHVPYKGSGPALVDLMGGQIQVMFENLPTALPYIQSGKLKALAVTSQRRDPRLPSVPTVDEAGVPGYYATSWFTIAAPRGVPSSIVEKLNADLRRALSTTEAAEEFRKLGIGMVANSAADAAKFIAAETEKWDKVIKAAGMRVD